MSAAGAGAIARVQHAVAEMALELEAIEPHLDRVCDDWSQGVDHGADSFCTSANAVSKSSGRSTFSA